MGCLGAGSLQYGEVGEQWVQGVVTPLDIVTWEEEAVYKEGLILCFVAGDWHYGEVWQCGGPGG